MGRPREFNTDDALDKAMHVFWAKGFDGTSLRELTSAMKISKSSFYDTFGSKHELFLSALDRYNSTVAPRNIIALLDEEENARKAIKAVFDRYVDNLTDRDGTSGCFINKCAAERADRDPAAASRICKGLDGLECAMLGAIRRGHKQGTIGRTHKARALARYLVSALNGLTSVGRANPDRKALGDVARIALAALD